MKLKLLKSQNLVKRDKKDMELENYITLRKNAFWGCQHPLIGDIYFISRKR